MLVLTRKAGEAITIGDQITLKILEVKGNHIRIGVDAPPEFRIYREEVYLKVKEQNRLAAAWNMNDFENIVNLISDGEKE